MTDVRGRAVAIAGSVDASGRVPTLWRCSVDLAGTVAAAASPVRPYSAGSFLLPPHPEIRHVDVAVPAWMAAEPWMATDPRARRVNVIQPEPLLGIRVEVDSELPPNSLILDSRPTG